MNAPLLPSPAREALAVGATPTWVLLAYESKARGFRNALAFRRWCRRRGVSLRKDGKLLWVNPRDVDRAVETLGPLPVPPASDAEAAERAMVEAAADALTRQARR